MALLQAALSSASAAPALRRAERTIAELPAEGDRLRVVVTVVHSDPPDGWPDSSAFAVRILSGGGTVQYADSLAVLAFCEGDGPERRCFDADTTAQVALYRAPAGGLADTVTVTPSSRVDFGKVYAVIREGAVEIKRLEVTVDGRHGYVEERHFMGLGLHPAG